MVTVILAAVTGRKSVGHHAALAVGATVALDGLFAAPVRGASMDSARASGPALGGRHLDTCWIYLAGPKLGVSCDRRTLRWGTSLPSNNSSGIGG
ncbi:MAG: aquaporin [Kofleriaceae bacterium]